MPAPAPVALFVFKRVDHLRATLDSLRRCEGFAETKFHVFGDGPRTAEEAEAVEATRRLAREQLGRGAEYHFRDRNLGLAASIIEGVDELTRHYGRVIVVEDDLELAAPFLKFMNAALDAYADEPVVFQVSGHMFDVPEFRNRNSAVFLPFPTTWGWGTWGRAWERFDPAATGWEALQNDRRLRRRFNLDGTYDYATMLEGQMTGRRDSWGIRWYWSVFRGDGAVCFPPVSMVRNTGMDGSGTHGRGIFRRFDDRGPPRGSVPVLPRDPIVDSKDYAAVKGAIWRQNGGWVGASADRLRRELARFRRGAP